MPAQSSGEGWGRRDTGAGPEGSEGVSCLSTGGTTFQEGETASTKALRQEKIHREGQKGNWP